jgi:hypothetical protein
VTTTDLLAALEPIVAVLESLGVPYYVGGSVASTAHGVPRASVDADVVTALGPEHVQPLVGRLRTDYYVDEIRVRAAIQARRSFNAIHLATMFKIDVFVTKGRPFDREAMQRARPMSLGDAQDQRRFAVASAEDTILAKLEWFRGGGEVSERQWTDVCGLLKALQPSLDRDYLDRWAKAVGVQDLLDRARGDLDSTAD